MNRNIFQWRSLKTRVAFTTLAIFVIGIWSLAFYASRMLREDMQHLLGEQQFSTVSYIAADVNQQLDDRFRALEAVAGSVSPAMLGNTAALQALLEQHPILQSLFNGGAFATRIDGTATASIPLSQGRNGVNYTDRDFIAAALKEGKVTIGRPVIGKKLLAPMFNMAVPIRDTQGNVIGALAGVTNLGMPNFLDRITEGHYGKTGGYLLVAPQYRQVVTATDKSRIMEALPAPGVNPLIDSFIQGYEGSAVIVNPLGVEMLASDKGIPLAGWIISALLPTAEAFAPIRAMQQRMLIATLFLTLMAGVLVWAMLRRHLSPMLATLEQLAAMSDERKPLQKLPTADGEMGQLIGGFNRLLESLRQREAALKESEYRWKFALEGSGDGVWDVNIQTQELFYSKRYHEMLGYAKGEFKRVHIEWLDHIHPEDKPRMVEARNSYVEGRTKNYADEYRLRCKDGSYKWILTRGMVVSHCEDGKPLRMIGTHTDITKHKLAEAELLAAKAEAERANNSKSRFLAAASHDLRQPLSALSLYVGLLNNRIFPEKDKLVADIQDCVASLSDLLTDLLDVSKLDAGVIQPKLSDFNVDGLLNTLVSVHSIEAELKGLSLRLRCSGGAVRSDRQLLNRVLGNVVANAIQYTRTGGVLIACRHAKGKWWVEVWDTGIGIAEDKTGIIFDEFRQLGDEARNRGSGLGLSIVAKTVALLGLQIRLRSRPGRGTMFAVELPLGRRIESAIMPAMQAATRPLRIALVDDHAKLLQALALTLEGKGHEVVAGTDVSALLEGLGDHAPDIVVSDYRLSANETGFDVISAVRGAFGRDLPAILITGDTDPSLVRSMAARGIAVNYKPFQLEELLALIATATDRRLSRNAVVLSAENPR